MSIQLLAASCGSLAIRSNEHSRSGARSAWALALALLVPGVALADDHDAAVATDHLAVIADRLDARVDLHRSSLLAVIVNRFDETKQEPLLSNGLLVAVDDPAASQVVGAQLHDHAVLGEDADVVLAHLARDMSENLVAVGQLNAEHRVGKSFDNRALNLDDAVLFGHTFFYRSRSRTGRADCHLWLGWVSVRRHARSVPKAPKIEPTAFGGFWPSQVYRSAPPTAN